MAGSFSVLPKKVAQTPSPFTVSIPESQLTSFHILLSHTSLPEPTYETLQDDLRYGISHSWLFTARERWLNGFSWRASEKRINSFANFRSQITTEKGSFNIHFAALFSKKVDAVPLLLVHGWPGSFLEFLPLMDILRQRYTEEELPYHIIVPSMPGFGFSAAAPNDRELDIEEVPEVFHHLMLGLGFGDGYAAQGGDLGARIVRIMGVKFEACKAVHVNVCFVSQPPDVSTESLTDKERVQLECGRDFLTSGSAYMQMHRTRPGTLGLVLGSNPLALLAWIGEKFVAWSDETPDLDIILESVMLYWLTESGGRSLYPYRQITASGKSVTDDPEYFLNKPFGFSSFPKEIYQAPRSFAAATGNLIFYREHEKGGHFAALEQPDILLEDLHEFIKQVWEK